MSQVINDRDVLLQNAAVRSDNPKQGKAILMSASSSVFKINGVAASPAAIVINVSLVGLNGNPTITVAGASKLVGNTGLTRTLLYADVTADTVEVTATLTVDDQIYTAKQTIVKVVDGAPGQQGPQGPQGAKGDSGINGAAGISNAPVYAYKRSAAVPNDAPDAVVYNFVSATIVQPSGNALGNGWFKEIPTGNDPLYVRVASACSSGETDNISPSRFTAPVLMAKNGQDGQNGRDGQNGQDGQNGRNGINTAPVYIYQRSNSPDAPALPNASVTYIFATATLNGLNNGWLPYVPPTGGRYLHVTSSTAASAEATDTISPSEWNAVTLMTKDGVNGADGLSNAKVYAYKRSAAVPSDAPDAVVYNFVSATIVQPSGNALGNGWFKEIPTGNDPLYVRVASASSSGETDNISPSRFTAPVLMAKNGQDGQNGRDGQNGQDGQNGRNGINTAPVYIYQRSDSSNPPALPTADVTYVFSTATVTGLNSGWVINAPVTGGKYLHVSLATAASTDASDVIAPNEWKAPWVLAKDGDNGSPGVQGPPGQNGSHGTTSAYARCYQWSMAGAPTIAGASELTFSTGLASSIPLNWYAVKPVPPARGATLYEASVLVTDSSGALKKSFDWGVASIAAIGYVGLDGENGAPGQPGQNGANGAQGASAVIGYCLIDGNSLNQIPAFLSMNGKNLPTTGTWGEARAWQWDVPTPSAGQSVMQTVGTYNPLTDKTIWGLPYVASGKFGSLSAVTTNTGSLTVTGTISSANGNFQVDEQGRMRMRSGTTGPRTEMTNALWQLLDDDGSVLIRIGIWA